MSAKIDSSDVRSKNNARALAAMLKKPIVAAAAIRKGIPMPRQEKLAKLRLLWRVEGAAGSSVSEYQRP
jgi:hypothetical protein